MAVFSRRTIQDLIDQSSSFLNAEQIRRKVDIFNTEREATIPTEWELASLVAFARLGHVFHEHSLGGDTKPDVFFTPAVAPGSIAVDITAVSDKHLHEENPFEAFMVELARRIRRKFPQGVRGNFHFEVRPESRNAFRGGGPTRLRMPQRHKFKRIVLNNDFDAFLVRVAVSPRAKQFFSVKRDDADICITFNPGREGLSGSHALYTAAHSKTSNPVANALHTKAKQLRECGFPGPYGIVLCDGGCELLTRRHADWASFHVDDVVSDFLRRNQSISFVLKVIVRADDSGRIGRSHLNIEQKLYANRAFSALSPGIQQSVARVAEFLPHPERTALNASNYLAWIREAGQRGLSDSFYGGLTMSERKLKMSLRTVQEVLAGRIDPATFDQAHGFDHRNPFLRNLEAGRLIAAVDVQKSENHEDDDWMVFTFGDPDPAVSPFRTPK